MPVSPIMTDATLEGPQPFELLRRLELLRALDDLTLKALAEGVEPIQLEEGEVLVRQGASDDALYTAASGTLRAITVLPSGEEKLLERYGPGQVFGEVQLVLGGAWTANIKAESPCLLYRLTRAMLDAVSNGEAERLEPLVWVVRSRLGRAQMAEVLPAFLGPLGPQELDALEQQVQWVTLRRGEALFRQGDAADGWYIVMSGRLRILRRDEFGDLKNMWEVGRGDSVGELGLLSGGLNVGTPYAIRDTELIRFSPEGFHALLDRYPVALKKLTGTLIQKSIVTPHASSQRRASTRYFTIVPTGPSAPAAAFAGALREKLSTFGPTLYLDPQELSTLGVMRDAAKLPDSHPQWLGSLPGWRMRAPATPTSCSRPTPRSLPGRGARCGSPTTSSWSRTRRRHPSPDPSRWGSWPPTIMTGCALATRWSWFTRKPPGSRAGRRRGCHAGNSTAITTCASAMRVTSPASRVSSPGVPLD